MKDDNGLYYYPNPVNKQIKMYVHKKNDEIWFRMMKADDPKMWDEHGWVPYDAVVQASRLAENKKFDPLLVYDIQIARELIREEQTDDNQK
ncbi:MAG TPA: hypothetical protein VLP30_04655 [Desulfatirhabdiaceae bacterium]|nr:hypothetical protein [Desulfatirhabdiaceae bacterium]